MNVVGKIIALSLFIALWTSCSGGRSNDAYLSSLPELSYTLEPIDSLDLEQQGILLPSSVVKYGRWVIIKASQAKYNLAIINLDSHSKMDAIRVGRGPGEMLQGRITYLDGNKLVVTEVNALTVVSLDLDLLREGYIPPLDTIGCFKPIEKATYRFIKINDGYISLAKDYDSAWYSMWDVDGYVGNSVIRPRVPGFEKASLSAIGSFYGSSMLTAHPDGNRACVVLMGMAALSFSTVENRELKEIKRVEYNVPEVVSVGGEIEISNWESKHCFEGIDSDRDYVYLLYSGKKGAADENGVPAFEGNHLLVYDWDGNPVAHYYLSHGVHGVYVDGNELYCLSWHPSPMLYVYRLPEIS